MATQTTSRREFHPAVSISSWLILAVTVEFVTPSRLLWLLPVGAALLANAASWSRFIRLVWKARWLWLAMIALYGWTVPGMLVWPTAWSPTLAGLEAGVARMARLLLLLAALARLMSVLVPAQIAGGLYLLTKPFAWLGLDRRALAVRLALTLEQAETMPSKKNWLDRLKSPPPVETNLEAIRLTIPQISLLDMGILLLSVALLGVVFT